MKLKIYLWPFGLFESPVTYKMEINGRDGLWWPTFARALERHSDDVKNTSIRLQAWG